ncbi:MAG: DUF2914 domain-containing protein [Methylococcaceae bacterium]|jgi:Protein of unknown function (DUF2914)
MEEKKNIVIKVKYPSNGKKVEPDISQLKVITEWNIKRIVLAFTGVVLFIVMLVFFLKPDTKNTEQPVQSALSENNINIPDQSKEINKPVIRSLLTFKIDNNEPVGEISLPLKLSKKKSTSVYYYVELTGMEGHSVYHEWLLDGALITRKKVNISNGNWRTSSRQLFVYNDKTNWTARLVDETGRLLNEIQFNVIYE